MRSMRFRSICILHVFVEDFEILFNQFRQIYVNGAVGWPADRSPEGRRLDVITTQVTS